MYVLLAFKVDQIDIDWNRILKNDPLSCAQLAICQIVAGAEQENHDAIIINTLVEWVILLHDHLQLISNRFKFLISEKSHFFFFFNILFDFRYAMSNGVPNEIETAYNHGKNFWKSDKQCYTHYPYCPYSTRTMLKLLQFYSYLFGG